MERTKGLVASLGLAGLFAVLGIGLATWGMEAGSTTAESAEAVAAASASPPSGAGWTAWGARVDGTPLRWDPCRAVDWVVRPRDPDWLVPLATRALDEVGAEAGITFRHVGRQRGAVGPDRRTAGDDGAWQPVLVTMTTPGEVAWLGPDDRALAVPVLVSDTFVTGQVLLDADLDLARDFSTRDGSWGATLLHEAAHLVGLDHVEDPDQLLYPRPRPGAAELSEGDRRGLRALAADGSCLDPGPVRDLPVATPRRAPW